MAEAGRRSQRLLEALCIRELLAPVRKCARNLTVPCDMFQAIEPFGIEVIIDASAVLLQAFCNSYIAVLALAGHSVSDLDPCVGQGVLPPFLDYGECLILDIGLVYSGLGVDGIARFKINVGNILVACCHCGSRCKEGKGKCYAYCQACKQILQHPSHLRMAGTLPKISSNHPEPPSTAS